MSKTSIELAAALVLAVTLDELKVVADAAIGSVREHEEALTEAEKYNEFLQRKIESLGSGDKVKPEFKLESKRFTVEHAVNIDGVVYKPEVIAENVDIQKQLVASNSTAVLEVTE